MPHSPHTLASQHPRPSPLRPHPHPFRWLVARRKWNDPDFEPELNAHARHATREPRMHRNAQGAEDHDLETTLFPGDA